MEAVTTASQTSKLKFLSEEANKKQKITIVCVQKYTF
jgi:hypothetical protein